ncbi:hypothetical protein [Saccharopolyspora shandongensis]|uniref:hypothetical protein n=1 Tax=Saccharopolyspora shandongensis TaxID=418495 RepID=UPI0033EE6254
MLNARILDGYLTGVAALGDAPGEGELADALDALPGSLHTEPVDPPAAELPATLRKKVGRVIFPGPSTTAARGRRRPRRSCEAGGRYMTCYFAGGAIGSALAGVVHARAGWIGVCALGAVLALALCLVWAAGSTGFRVGVGRPHCGTCGRSEVLRSWPPACWRSSRWQCASPRDEDCRVSALRVQIDQVGASACGGRSSPCRSSSRVWSSCASPPSLSRSA